MTNRAPPELFVVVFPCGAFRTCRTQDAAEHEGLVITSELSCCRQGHRSFEIWRYDAAERLGAGAAIKPRARLRLVKG